MDLIGINIPSWTVAIGLIITAFFTGIGIGLGSEIGKYLVNKYVTHKIDYFDQKVRKISIKEYLTKKHGGKNMTVLKIDIESLEDGMYRTKIIPEQLKVLGVLKVGDNKPEEKNHINLDKLEDWLHEKLVMMKR